MPPAVRLAIHNRAHLADRWGIGLAALCAAHCITTAIVVTALASFGGVFLNPVIHEVGLAIAVVLGAIGLGTGIIRHGYMMPFATGSFGLGMMAGSLSLPHGSGELAATLVGLMVLALGHDLNFRARS
ncbi:MAG: MerC domain-containing protein [Sphingopyxis sp.]